MVMTIEILRPDDLIHLTIEVSNLRLDTANPRAPALVREDPAQDAFLVAVFPPQCFAEQVLQEVDPPGTSEAARPPGEYAARLSGTSRLAFRVPIGLAIPFSIKGLLDWTKLEPALTPIGSLASYPVFLIAPAPAIERPSATQTAIELPYRLILSPGPGARWRHRLEPASTAGRTVLWHTRLVAVAAGGQPIELGAERTAPIRAVYSPDYDAGQPPQPSKAAEFPMALKPYDRHALVRLTSTFRRRIVGPGQDIGRPAETRRLALTSLGGFLDAEGRWPDGPQGFSFSSWTHIAALGRDSYVRVTYRGRLLPLMNRATLVKITERRFEPSPLDGSPVAYLRQYIRILLDEREVSYEGQPFVHDGREMPLARVRVNVDATPKIENPDVTGAYIDQTSSFEVRLGGAFWPFPCTAIDRAGNAVDFTIGMIFVPDDDIPARLPAVVSHYRALPKEMSTATANNAKIKLADFGSSNETTAFVVASFHFDVDLGRGAAGFLPKLGGIDVRVPSLELLTGNPKPAAIAFTPSYLANGFDPAAGLFAEIAGDGNLEVAFAADQAGGIAQPNLSVRGFSRDFGPIAGDLSNIATGGFDPTTAFSAPDAKLFGALPIKDILGTSALDEAAPKITTGPDPAAPDHILTSLVWETRTKGHSIGAVTFTPADETRLSIIAEKRKRVAKAQEAATSGTQSIVKGRLNDFTVELMDVVVIHIAEFRFSSDSGRAPEVEVKLRDETPIEFKGALDFVRKLSELMPPGIFGQNGPRLTLRPDAIEVGFCIALPPAALGVFSIRNIAISTTLTLPFLTGRPSLAFGFATREKPFQLSVLILGGGGFARVELDTEGVRAVEVMFEFGGMFALDVGVASGSVHILAGIYIGLKGEASELTGYVRVGGEVTVLAIISISVEFMLSLSYYPGPKVAKGVASITVSVRIAFISKSVSFSVERTFDSGSRHLSIGEAMTADDWADYAAALN